MQPRLGPPEQTGDDGVEHMAIERQHLLNFPQPHEDNKIAFTNIAELQLINHAGLCHMLQIAVLRIDL